MVNKIFVLCFVATLLVGCASTKRFGIVETIVIDPPEGKTTYFGPVLIDIPAGEANDTICQWARQTDVGVLFPFDEVKGIPTHALQGIFERPEDALRELLGGTGLEFREVDLGSFFVARSE